MVPTMMKAIVIEETGGVEALKFKDWPIPEIKEGEILVKNAFTGVNFIDTYQRSGTYPLKVPFVLGREGAGIVHSVHPSLVEGALKPGDRVAYIGNGSYGQYTAVSTKHVIKVPDEVKLEDAAAGLLQTMTASYLVTDSYKVQRGDWILVTAAAGGTGGLITQLAAGRGARVIGLCSTDAKAQLARANGAEQVLDPAQPDLAPEVMRLTDGQGVRVFYDGIGKDMWPRGLACVAKRGHYINFGNASGVIESINPFDLTPKCRSFMRTGLFSYIETREEFEQRTSRW